MFNITICNDNYEEVKALKEYLKQYSKENNIEYKLSIYTKFETLITYASKPTDILLIDIKLENKQVVTRINNQIQEHFKNVEVIYMCDILRFMMNGFNLKELRYILKPIKYESLEEELNDSINELQQKDEYTDTSSNISLDVFNNLEGSEIKDIFFIEDIGDECIVITDKSEVRVPYTIDELERILNNNLFFRCNEDYIINIRKISKIGKYFIVSKCFEIPVSKDKFKILKDKLKIMLNII